MSVPEAAVSSFLENLTQLIQHKDKLLMGDVRENILILQQELAVLRVLLKDLAKYDHVEYLKDRMNQIRNIIEEAEDEVDGYLLVQKPISWMNFKLPFHHKTSSKSQLHYRQALRNVAMRIRAVGLEVRRITEKKVKRGSQARDFQVIRDIINEAPKVEEEHVIGFDGASQQVEALLTGGPEHLEVISIVGMVGLGKTTLAKKVYRGRNVDYEFMVRAFVFVSIEYDKREVLFHILTSLTQSIGEEVTKMSAEELEKLVYQQLEGKQYLVVLDGVWETEYWDRVRDAFPNNKKRCRVLITTRNEKVAEYANPKNPNSLYKLNFLTLDEGRELLRWRVFHENHCPRELQEYEIEITKKCDGLPSAIVAIAAVLVKHKERIDWWKDVAMRVRDYIARDTAQTAKAIELSYKNLPNHLKPCFLYLGVFPENFEIPVWKLVRLWIAEGLVQQEGDSSLEDIAEQYLEELVRGNLVMVGRRSPNDRIKTCRLLLILHALCKKEATEENLFQEIKRHDPSFFSSGNPILYQSRRLCFNNVIIADRIPGTLPLGKCVRSFLTFAREEPVMKRPERFSSILKSTVKLLRVLEAQPFNFTAGFPIDLCRLVLLKYVAISSNCSSLPLALSALWNLQTLIVDTPCRTLEIRADICKMPQFRHLHTNASASLPYCTNTESQKTKEEALAGKSVQTLSTISPESCRKEVFDRTPNLKKLGILGTLTKLFEVSDSKGSLFGNLRNLESLENLKLLNDDVTSRLQSLPSEESFPKQLTKLTLFNTFLDWKEMSTLGKLHKLEALKLGEYAFEGRLWLTEKGGFWRLKHLHIGRTNLVVWEVSSDHFPTLRSLELNGCEKLQAVPQGLADIPSLQSVVLYCTNPQVASSARRLQILKLQQTKKSHRSYRFKLSVYPPEH